MNITDIDDKIINRANEKKIKCEKLVDKFLKAFYEDMKALNMFDSINYFGKATDHVPEIIDQIKELIEKGYAYEVDGNVYFEVKKFKDFGKLSHQSLEHLEAGARVEVDEKKKNPEDFVLWKKHKEGEPFWNSPWGKGRPGWHIEDTAISTSYFNEQYDLHGGAIDLIFPHHESEIAIAESITGKKPFVKYWLHTGYLNISGEKMSKSLGNILKIKDMLKRYEPEVLRFFLIYTHYRSPIDFSDELLEEAKSAWEYIKNTVTNIRELTEEKNKERKEGGEGEKDEDILNLMEQTEKEFFEQMDDDFNTREAIARIFNFSREINRVMEGGKISKETLTKILDLYENKFGIVLGLSFTQRKEKTKTRTSELIENLIQLIVSIRNNAREKKDFETSDAIRTELERIGIELADSPKGTKWKLKEIKEIKEKNKFRQWSIVHLL
jgi:cysteinyl-tRNA synthetase